MYTELEQSTGVAFRCINDNLPKYLDNARMFRIAADKLSAETLEQLSVDMADVCGEDVKRIFSIETFSSKLSQTGIDMYNSVIGGYTKEDGTKVQGLNEYINLYNQLVGRNDRIPKMKPLYKQILSDRDTVSFIPEKFGNDQEVLDAVNSLFKRDDSGLLKTIDEIGSLFSDINEYDLNKIYVSAGPAVTDISNGVFGAWDRVISGWNTEYDERVGFKDSEIYIDKRKSAFKRIESFSIFEIERLGNIGLESPVKLAGYVKNLIIGDTTSIKATYESARVLLENKYEKAVRLSKSDEDIELIKNLLDAVKTLERHLKMFQGSGKEVDKDENFYGVFVLLLDNVRMIDRLYDKVRNYVTQKPYSEEKFKINFQNPQFLGGWDRNKEKDYRSTMIRRDGNYYLVVMDKSNSKAMESLPTSSAADAYEKIDYKLLPDPSKMLPHVAFSKKGIASFMPSDEVLRVYKGGTFKKGKDFDKTDLRIIIDYYKYAIANYESWQSFDFKFKDTAEYQDIGVFFADVKSQGYKLLYRKVDARYIDELVENGQIYLFKLYNKDFSDYSTGNPNLHTLYFRMLFDEKNAENIIFQMNGGAEMFYRSASIKKEEIIRHPARQAVKNKNPFNEKKESLFDYELIKDRRYTEDKFFLHLPITLNFNSAGTRYIDDLVRQEICKDEDTYVIGIDRGERNLIYICVINGKGELVEQMSLNEIINEGNGVVHRTDYQGLLAEREMERTNARRDWKSVENIKELKEGYISQVIFKICELMKKYDAVIAVEDLNSGFKNSRIKIERQVYQKFENMLISKLNYLASKNGSVDAEGGLLKAYQLTNKVGNTYFNQQNGFIFYVPAWLTSKIDPTTGFVNLLKIKYENVNQAKSWISSIDDIRYNAAEGLFEFDIDYDKFIGGSTSYVKKWTICSNGTRIRTFRNPEKNSEWDNQEIVLTDELKTLFAEYGINVENGGLKAAVLECCEKDFFVRFMSLIKMCVQLRNSITGRVDVDYLISPVRGSDGRFYDSRDYEGMENAALPQDADANGAYNIARKGLWALKQIREAEDIMKVRLSISNKEWLEEVQKRHD